MLGVPAPSPSGDRLEADLAGYWQRPLKGGCGPNGKVWVAMSQVTEADPVPEKK